MAGEDNLLSKLAALVAAYDEAAWEAIASKGLLRRARKDIEKGPRVVVTTEDAHEVKIEVPPFVVTIPEAGPAKATCTCPSPGICQHIIVAGLWLQQKVGGESPAAGESAYESAAKELLSFSTEDLQKWAGIAAFRQAVVIASAQGDVAIEQSIPVIIKLPSLDTECRYMPGPGLDGIIVSGGTGRESGKCAVAAVLLFQLQAGKPLPEAFLAEAASAESTGAPRTRDEILFSVQQILEQALEAGLSHASSSTKDRLVTLSVSAQGANLPRLALMLRGVADEVGLIVNRNAQADEARLLLLAARLYALTRAIQNSKTTPRGDLVGSHRSQYHDLASLDLAGVAAYPWRTRSGYRGLTLLLWDNRNRQWFSWSHARPENQTFDPISCYKGDGPWQGTQSPEQVSRSQVKLMNLRKNAQGRLSSSAQTRAIVTGCTSVRDLDFGDRQFTQWDTLNAYAEKISPLGLRESNPLDDIVVVQAASWSSPEYDDINQSLSWLLLDPNGAALCVKLAHDTYGASAIRFLENIQLSPVGAWKLIGKIVRKVSGLSLHPITILKTGDGEHIFHLALEQSVPATAIPAANENRASEDVDGHESDDGEDMEAEIAGIPLERRIAAVLRQVDLIAEAGAGTINQPRMSDLILLSTELDACGLSVLGRTCRLLTEKRVTRSRNLLYLRYLCELYQQAALKSRGVGTAENL